jgi:hypothetical protein
MALSNVRYVNLVLRYQFSETGFPDADKPRDLRQRISLSYDFSQLGDVNSGGLHVHPRLH